MSDVQQELVFFGDRHSSGNDAPTDEWKMSKLNRENPESPFHKFIGNEPAVRKMTAAAFTALGRENHLMRELAFSIFGPSSAGKTTLARLYAETVELPFMEISPKSLRTVDDLFRIISNTLQDEGLPLVEQDRKKFFLLPPCVIFIDEVHALTPGVVDGLLKATEFTDSRMVTESGITVNTENATWMIATTDEGKLFEAFRTRFSPIVLKYLSKSDIAKIVKLANPDLSDEVCGLVAHYNSRIPRKALEFARYMRMVSAMNPSLSWVDVTSLVAADEGIDEFGMNEVHLKILRALGLGPVAKNRVALIAGRKEEEVERNILPWLLTETEDQKSLIGVSSKGYVITEFGLKELERRGIHHVGEKAIAV